MILSKLKQDAEAYLGDKVTEAVITEISVTGSLLIIGIGLNVLGLTKLRIMNMAPALLLPVLLCKFM